MLDGGTPIFQANPLNHVINTLPDARCKGLELCNLQLEQETQINICFQDCLDDVYHFLLAHGVPCLLTSSR